MSGEKLFHVGVKALLTRPDGMVLVMKTGPFKDDEAHWDLAGGRIEEGQTEIETLKREIEEETGLTEFGEPIYFGSCISNIQIPLENGAKAGLVLIAYKVPVPEGAQITISDEHSEIAWVSMSEAADKLAYKYPKAFTDLLRA